MNLNHLGLGVTEVHQNVAMFEKYFGLRRVDHSPANDKMGFLNDDRGALITIFRVPDANYPKIFHIGFMQDTVEQVHAIHQHLRTDGFAPEDMGEEYDRKTFYFKAPGGFTVEVNAFITKQQPPAHGLQPSKQEPFALSLAYLKLITREHMR